MAVLRMERFLVDQQSRGVFSRAWITRTHESSFWRGLTAERNWAGNERGQSCVPAGFYHLVPHDGSKYKDTFALVGGEVEHWDRSLPGTIDIRTVCVFHWEDDPAYLAGCVSAGESIQVTGKGSKLEGDSTGKLVECLRDLLQGGEQIYCHITWARPLQDWERKWG